MNNKLDINTLEGWNEHIRQGNIKDLLEKGIEPTEKNIEEYEIERLKAYAEKGDIPDTNIIPIFYYVDNVRFNTEKEALEYKEIIKTLEDNPELVSLLNMVKDDEELIKIATDKLIELKADRELD